MHVNCEGSVVFSEEGSGLLAEDDSGQGDRDKTATETAGRCRKGQAHRDCETSARS